MTEVSKFLGYGRQSIDRSDVDAVVGVLWSDFLTQGNTVDRFESALAERVGARYAVAVSNGTAALHIACLAAGVGPGDFGLTSAITFAASANCLLYAGADAGFVDVDGRSLGMSPRALTAALAEGPPAKVVVPVHLAGLASDMSEIRDIGGDRLIIEDAAQALGASYECGRPIGCCAYSQMASFSFHAVKSITTGEGGAVVTNDPDIARRLRMFRNHGIERDSAAFVGAETREDGGSKPWLYEQQLLGFNYRMTDIQAALGLSQLRRLDAFLARRREIARCYDEAFGSLDGITIPQSRPHERARSAHHLYIAIFDFERLRTTRGAVMTALKDRGIGSQVHYIPVYRHPYYVKRYGIKPALFPEAEAYYRGCLSLPLFPGLTDSDVERVIKAVTEVVGQ